MITRSMRWGSTPSQGGGGQVLDTGQYVAIWHHEAGQWKIHRDIWNRPAAGP